MKSIRNWIIWAHIFWELNLISIRMKMALSYLPIIIKIPSIEFSIRLIKFVMATLWIISSCFKADPLLPSKICLTSKTVLFCFKKSESLYTVKLHYKIIVRHLNLQNSKILTLLTLNGNFSRIISLSYLLKWYEKCAVQ